MLLLGFLAALVLYMIIRKKNLSPKDRIIKEAMRFGKMDQDRAKIVAAIAAHETGNFKSRLSQPPYNNFFGMHYAAQRNTKAIGKDESNWAKFASIESSVDDFLMWFEFNKTSFKDFSTVQDAIFFMKEHGYFSDDFNNYYSDVLAIFKQYLNE